MSLLRPGSRDGTERTAKTQAEWFCDQARQAWQTGQTALASGRLDEARRWLERACRFAPRDVAARLSLAVVLLRLDDREAASLFAAVTHEADVREAWLGLAAAQAHIEEWAAAAALSAGLRHHVLGAGTDLDALAMRIARGAGAPGWCCVQAGGKLRIRLVSPKAGRAQAALDGAAMSMPPKGVPPQGDMLAVAQGGAALLGSPLDLARMRRVEGQVDLRDGRVEGWAWLPANPEVDPLILLRPERGLAVGIVASDTGMLGHRPMARPRRFSIAASGFGGGLLQVRGPDGCDLPGSPIDLSSGLDEAGTIARAVAACFPAANGGGAPPSIDPRLIASAANLRGRPAAAACVPARPLAIVVPVYRDAGLTLRCLEAVRAHGPADSQLIVVDDATPEPELALALDALAARGEIHLVRHPGNRGFPAAANAGMRAALALPGEHDVVLLNSDAIVSEGALEVLRSAVHGAPDIGTATPLSNDATILSYPRLDGINPMPGDAEIAALARLARSANAGVAIEIPTAVGFCMYVRRECLEQTGVFREDVFGAGYGEENDFCSRARHLGWRHVAAPSAFVAHAGGTSFGASRHARIVRNLAVLERLHPGYHALIEAFQAEDPLAGPRRALDAARWAAARPRKGARAAILITHDSGGGVERLVRERCDQLRREGLRPIVLRSVPDPAARSTDERTYLPGVCQVADGTQRDYPNLRFDVTEELPALVRLLRPDRPAFVEVHHLLGHDHSVTGLAAAFGIPYDILVHDYAWLCPRITLLGAERRYCGEPTNPAVCEACIADLGRNDEETLSVAALRARSANDLGRARSVVVSCTDVATRMRRHFPAIRTDIRPLEDDAALPPAQRPLRQSAYGTIRRVCVVGGIGPEKGYDVLLACARDAAMRDLPLEFVVVGHTADDARLLATGRVFVTGPYQEARAVEEIRAQRADIGFLPSIWPETWCYTLGHAWRAGLSVAAFDIGAPAERIRRTGRGWLLPLGLPSSSVNNALLAARTVAGDECAVSTPC